MYERRWRSGSHERDFVLLHEVSAHRAAICCHPLSKTTCSGRDLRRHRGHTRYRCSVPSSTSRPLPECSGYWVLWGRAMFSRQEGGTHTVVLGVVFPPPPAVHLRGVQGFQWSELMWSAALPPLPLPLALPAMVTSPAQDNRASEPSLGRVVSRNIRNGHLQDLGCIPLSLGVPLPRAPT